MTCHIEIKGQCFCMTGPLHGLKEVAYINEVPTTCDHETAGNAVALVHLLQDFGAPATIVDGCCDWNPNHPDMRPLWKAWRKVNKEATV